MRVLRVCLAVLFLWASASAQLGIPRQKDNEPPTARMRRLPRLQAAISQLHEHMVQGGATAARQFAASHRLWMDEQERVRVYLLPETGGSPATIDARALAALGVKIIKGNPGFLQVWAPVSRLAEIATQVGGLRAVQAPVLPVPETISEGVALTRASNWQTLGVDGSSVKVAVLDGSFDSISTAIAAGDLPGDTELIDCTGSACVVGIPGSGDGVHGTACAEIIHDMAPGAKIYLLKIYDLGDMDAAITWALANGIRIISHSVSWFNTNFYDGGCWNNNAACIAQRAEAGGILWVNSAGNRALQHWSGTWADSNGNGWNDFSAGDEDILVSLSGGAYVVLTWDSWPVTDQDYDLYLYNYNDVLIASSINLQNGSQEPTEEIYLDTLASGVYKIKIQHSAGNGTSRFHLFSIGQSLGEHRVAAGSVTSPADSPSTLTVGAIDYSSWTTGPQETYSSQGPTSDGRNKPDIAGPDCTISYVYGGTFCGTSASTPHVAGAAALVLSRSPSLSPASLRKVLTTGAIDMGATGLDPIYGAGRVNMPYLMNWVTAPPSSLQVGQDYTVSWQMLEGGAVQSTWVAYSSGDPISGTASSTPPQSGSPGTFSTMLSVPTEGTWLFAPYAEQNSTEGAYVVKSWGPLVAGTAGAQYPPDHRYRPGSVRRQPVAPPEVIVLSTQAESPERRPTALAHPRRLIRPQPRSRQGTPRPGRVPGQ